MANALTKKKTEFYVGQRVENKINGKGTVKGIHYNLVYPVLVLFKGKEHNWRTYSLSGKYFDSKTANVNNIRPLPGITEDKPMTATGIMDKIINRGLNKRMIANDTNPTPLAMKPVPEKTELTAKCALCGELCKPRNGTKFYSICGECK